LPHYLNDDPRALRRTLSVTQESLTGLLRQGFVDQMQLNLAGLAKSIESGDDRGPSLVLVDGRLASGGGDGQIKLWPRDGVGEPVILSPAAGSGPWRCWRTGGWSAATARSSSGLLRKRN
jgi:hypothetical protein